MRDSENHIIEQGGGAVISTLVELGRRQEARREAILNMIDDVRTKLAALGVKR